MNLAPIALDANGLAGKLGPLRDTSHFHHPPDEMTGVVHAGIGILESLWQIERVATKALTRTSIVQMKPSREQAVIIIGDRGPANDGILDFDLTHGSNPLAEMLVLLEWDEITVGLPVM